MFQTLFWVEKAGHISDTYELILWAKCELKFMLIFSFFRKQNKLKPIIILSRNICPQVN